MKQTILQELPCCAATIIATALQQDRRVLLSGPPGAGKSTLAAQLAHLLAQDKRSVYCLGADLGSPGFGIPGAVSLAEWRNDSWQVLRYSAVCSLDAGRFRLPLLSAVQHVLQRVDGGLLLLDGPGVVRGNAGAELLSALVQSAAIDTILMLKPTQMSLPLAQELYSLAVHMFVVNAAPQAKRPGKRQRARRRTLQWDHYLDKAVTQHIDINRFNVIGAHPPTEYSSAWIGRLIALQLQQQTQTMGEIIQMTGDILTVRLAENVTHFDTLLVRDAIRSSEGLIETASPFVTERFDYIHLRDTSESTMHNGGPRPVGRVGMLDVDLVNGVMGDPLLHVQLRHQRRSLFFDLGETGRLSTRVAHQVSDVFISHAHADHIAGFVWLLRARIGYTATCRLYGPPGLALNIKGFIQGLLWDRVAERGPCFDVLEVHDDQLKHYSLRIYDTRCELHLLDTKTIVDNVILQDAQFRVCAVTLDHGTPVLAYVYEAAAEVNIRKDRLQARRLTPGPWLTELKQLVMIGNTSARITLPDGSEESVTQLALDLVLVQPGKKLAYATDFSASEKNRQRLIKLIRQAHTFFCEASFIEADSDQAIRTGHLTTRACGEIATAAGVSRLIPFHFSHRYSHDLQIVYDEIQSVCACMVTPGHMSEA